METIKIYYNGFRLGESKELVKANIGFNEKEQAVTIYARNYSHLPCGYGFNVINESDCMTDYFESDHAKVYAEHPLYKFLRYAAMKDNAMFAKRILKKNASYTAKGYKYLTEDEAERYAARITEFEAENDPGQPTEADLKDLQDWMDEKAEKAKAEKEAKEAKEREEMEARVFMEQLETEMTINKWETEFPVVEGQATVEIPFSERRGIKDGSVWSLKAAQHIFEELDRREHAKHAGYDKTDFVIRWTENGEQNTYRGRYDIGDGENGLLQHIFNFAEWYRTHTDFGQPLENPPETTENIEIYKSILKQYKA